MRELEIMRWILSSVLLSVFLLIAFSNTVSLIRGRSFVPIAGAILGALGVILLPTEGAWKFFWIPFIFDPGTLIFLAVTVIALVRGPKGGGGTQ